MVGLRASGKVFGVLNTISLFVMIGLFLYSRTVTRADYVDHPLLLDENNLAVVMFFITILFQSIFNILNAVLGFTE